MQVEKFNLVLDCSDAGWQYNLTFEMKHRLGLPSIHFVLLYFTHDKETKKKVFGSIKRTRHTTQLAFDGGLLENLRQKLGDALLRGSVELLNETARDKKYISFFFTSSVYQVGIALNARKALALYTDITRILDHKKDDPLCTFRPLVTLTDTPLSQSTPLLQNSFSDTLSLSSTLLLSDTSSLSDVHEEKEEEKYKF